MKTPIVTMCLTAAAALLSPLAMAQPSVSSNYNFVTLDYPGSLATYPLGINTRRAIVGFYVDNHGILHGFLHKGSQFTVIDYPGAPLVPGGGSAAGGINERGDILGNYIDQLGFQHGYMRTLQPGCGDDDNSARCQPVFHSIDVPGAALTHGILFENGTGLGTNAIGINTRREIVGLYAATGLYSLGFLMSGDTYRAIDDPNSGHTPGLGTKLFGINEQGTIVGDYLTQASPTVRPLTHGFLLRGSVFTPIDVPGSENGGFGTQVNGINIFDEVVGIYSDPAGMGHGLVWARGTSYSLDYPGMPFSEAHAINALGDITGAYATDPMEHDIHGFVAYRKSVFDR